MSLMILIADSKWLFYATLRKKIATETTMAVIHQTSLALFAAIGLQCKKIFSRFVITTYFLLSNQLYNNLFSSDNLLF